MDAIRVVGSCLALAFSWVSGTCAATDLAATSATQIRFNSFTVEEGLPQNSVRALLQDRSGFLWIGTQDGLGRYDGRAIDVFRHRRDEADSLGDNHVTALAEDASGRIWIAHNAAGIGYFEPEQQRFVHLSATGKDLHGLPSARLQQLALDRSDRLWVVTQTGALARWDASSARFVAARSDAHGEFPAVMSIAVRAQGGLWFGTAQGLCAWSGQDGSAAQCRKDHPPGPVTVMAVGPNDTLWVGTQGHGLWQVDAADAVTRIALPLVEDTPGEILALLPDSRGRLWVGTSFGLLVLDAGSHALQAWARHDSGDRHSLAADRVVSLSETRDGLIWVGTWFAGMSVHDPRAEAFLLLGAGQGAARGVIGDSAPEVLANPDGSFWAAAGFEGGLLLLAPDGQVLRHFRHDPTRSDSLATHFIRAMAHGADGELWIGSGNAGLERLRPDRSGFEHFRTLFSNATAQAAPEIRGLYLDRAGTLWIGSTGEGIAARCRTCQTFRRYVNDHNDPSSFPVDGANAFLHTKNAELWVATRAHGVLRLDDAEAGRFSRVGAAVGSPGGMSHGSVTYLYEDPLGDVWAGTQGGGLNHLVRDAHGAVTRVEVYTTENGLTADAIGAILPDAEGRLWASTTRGISRFDPRDASVDSFEARLGAQLTYYIGAGDALVDGRIIFGGAGGVTVFDPAAVMVSEEPVHPLLTYVRRFDQSEHPGAGVQPGQTVAFAAGVTLNHRQNTVAFGFTAPAFRNTGTLGLAYRLEGRDVEWIRADPGQRSTTYSGLEAGNYRFRVRAWIGAWTDAAPEAEVRLRVLPAPWATPWAYALYVLAAVLLVLAISWPMIARLRERRLARAAIERSEQRLKLALWGSGDELWEIDLGADRLHRDHCLDWIPALADTDRDDLGAFTNLVHEAERDAYRERLQAIRAKLTDTFELAFRLRANDGDWKWLQARGRVVARDAAGGALRLAGTHQDITALKLVEERRNQLQEALRHETFHDGLTGLANRALFYEQLKIAMDAAESGERRPAILFVDLDEFKLLNDSLGPALGDRVLCAVGGRLRDLLSDEVGMVARLGGDEFALLVERAVPDQVFGLAARVADALRRPLPETGQPLRLSASIGVAFAAGAQSADEVLRNADLAMYRAKSAGRNRVEVYSPEMHDVFARRLSIVASLRSAIDSAAIHLHFQPIVELATGRWVGAEALARVALGDEALSSPAIFIPIAEEAGLIDELGSLILRHAIRDARRLNHQGASGYFITVNVSPLQLQNPGLAAAVQAAMLAANWPSTSLVLEITESTLMAVTDISRGNLARLRAMGVRLALDDFGTGYSSLAQLGRERFDMLKIAKPFVDGLPGSADSVHMVEAIVRMADSLHMSVIAEGVEHPAQAESLRRLGCSYAQGYEFGKPLPAPELAAAALQRAR